jgi:GAF domain-containing protein
MTAPLSARSFESGALAAATAAALAAARESLAVRRTALFWLDDDSGRLVCVRTAGASGAGGAEGWVGQTLSAGVGMAGRAVREGRPVWTPDLLADPRVPIATWLRERLVEERLRAVAAAPVRVGGVIRGALGFLDGPGRTYDDAALRRIEALADDVGVSAARAAASDS